MSKITKPSGSRQLIGLVVGFLAGDKLVESTKLPQGLPIFLGISIAIPISAIVIVTKFPRGSYGRKMYKYWVGQLGAWLASILIGGFLPLLKSFVYSGDFLTTVILVPWFVGVLYLFLVVQQSFQTPRPVKPSGKS